MRHRLGLIYRFCERKVRRCNPLPLVAGLLLLPFQLLRKLPWRKLAPARILARCQSLVPTRLRLSSMLLSVRRRRRELAMARLLMKNTQTRMILMSEDHVESVAPATIKAGHEAGAASVIIPYTLATAAEPAESYFDHPWFQVRSIRNRIVGWMYPKWIIRHRGRKLIRLPAASVLSMEWFKLAPPLPWQLNSGYADAIFVECQAIKDYFVRAGIPPEQIRVTGSIALDELALKTREAADRRSALLQKLNLRPASRLIVCALPPNQMDMRAHVTSFESYEALTEFWIDQLKQVEDANVIVSVHPRTSLKALAHLKSDRVRLLQVSAAELIPLCDLFVASISATIRWAIACGKPVLNYDVYRYRYDDFTSAPGVITMEEADAFVQELQKLTRDPDYFEKVRSKQMSVASQWGRLDGKAFDTMLIEWDRLVKREEPLEAAPLTLAATSQ